MEKQDQEDAKGLTPNQHENRLGQSSNEYDLDNCKQ